ncbi:MAG: bacteriocin [Oscillospiraceae bacterium]|nr:bacteriocin [Candidatus Limimonas egerieequi]
MSELNEKDLNEVNGGHTGPCTPAFELDTEPLKRLMDGEITMEEYQEIMKKNEQLAFGSQHNG